MPRLTTQRYLMAYQWLHDLWLQDPSVFDALTDHQRQLLARFFAFHNDHTERELRLHRRIVSTATPMLPYQAGKAFAQLRRLHTRVQSAKQPDPVPTTYTGRPIRVRGIRRKDIDEDKLALAFLLLAKEIHRGEQEASRDNQTSLLDRDEVEHPSGREPPDPPTAQPRSR